MTKQDNFRSFLREDSPSVLFLILYAVGIVSFWFSVYKTNYDYNNDFNSIVENAGAPISVSLFPIAVSFLFAAMLVFFCVYGFFFHNKLMLLISAAYSFFIFVGIILLAIFQTGQIDDIRLYEIVKWVFVFDFGPLFGFVWVFGKYAMWIFFCLFVTNAVFFIIKLVNHIKYRRKKI